MDGVQAQRGQACPPEVTPDAGKQVGAVRSRSLRVAACGLLGALSVLPLDSDDHRLPLGRATVEASCVRSLRNTPWVKEGNNPFAEVTWTPPPRHSTTADRNTLEDTECKAELERRGPSQTAETWSRAATGSQRQGSF